MFTLSACSVVSSLLSGATNSNPNVLFQDDFSKTSSGWDRTTTNGDSTDYKDGAYRITVETLNYDLWANPGKSFQDVKVEVDATMMGGPENNDFGIICRYKDIHNYYYGTVASDGYYGIVKVIDDSLIPLTGDGMVATDLVNAGSAVNHLRFDCVGSALTLYVNGTILGSVTDTDLTVGDVGLIAGTFDTAGTDIAFDNFVVSKP
jgi:hypothetical protein